MISNNLKDLIKQARKTVNEVKNNSLNKSELKTKEAVKLEKILDAIEKDGVRIGN